METLMTGIAFGESPRWHEGRLWFSDWGAEELIAVDLAGNSEVMLQVQSFPFCIDWLPDGRLLIVHSRDRLLLRREPDGTLVTHADLNSLSGGSWNEIVVDGRGSAYVNGAGFDLMAGEEPRPGIVALVTPDGSARQVADGVAFPNGMAVTPDNSTLIVAESYASRLTAFDIAADGALSNRRFGPTSGRTTRTASAWTRKAPPGTRTSETSTACASGKVERYCRRSTSTAAASPACSAARTGERCSWWQGSGMAWTSAKGWAPARC